MSSTLIDEVDVVSPSFVGKPHPLCRAIVVVPARNEEEALSATLDALRKQKDLQGQPLAHEQYEVLLLLNNCTDRSASVACAYAARHPEFHLRVEQCKLPAEVAHVGTARRMLMDAACLRLESLAAREGLHSNLLAILTTDADTEVAPDWVARNLAALDAGADAVGGVIHLRDGEIDAMEPAVRTCYGNDRKLQALVAQLESLLDPDPADPWPRHLEHFGASLACTCAIYRRSGGMPAVKPLEDVAFVDALRRAGARLRHCPEVHIYTSARLDGRAEVGLSGQLRHWARECRAGLPHEVDSAAWMVHRFGTMGRLRRWYANGAPADLAAFPADWQERIAQMRGQAESFPRFLELLDSNRLCDHTFAGDRRGEIGQVLSGVEAAIAELVSPG